MDSHDNLDIKLSGCKPKTTLVTKNFTYELLTSPTTRTCIKAKKDKGIQNYCGFTSLSDDSYVEFKHFFQFLSLSNQVLRKKYNHSSFTYDQSIMPTIIPVEAQISEIVEPKLIHEFQTDDYKCGIYICRSNMTNQKETQYQSVLNICDKDKYVTIVNMSDSDNILQTFFHTYITLLCSNQPFDIINTIKGGVLVDDRKYTTAKKFLTDLSKIVNNISNDAVSFDAFVHTIEKIMILAHKSRPYSLSKADHYKLLRFLNIYGTSMEAETLVELICMSDTLTICENKFQTFFKNLNQLKQNLSIGFVTNDSIDK